MLIAQSQVMGVEVSTLVAVITAIGVLFGIWKKMNAAKGEIAKEVMTVLLAQQAEQAKSTNVGPQPFAIQMNKEFVDKASYHKHAELNRGEHTRIDARITAIQAKMEEDKFEIIQAGEDRSKAIHDRINLLLENVGQIRGELNAIHYLKR